MSPKDVLDFWFAESSKKLWFNATPELDRDLTRRFMDTWQAAKQGRLHHWADTPSGALALIIVLDQFPLNMFRGHSLSFSTAAAARDVAQWAVEQGFDRDMSDKEKLFLYMPFMHSENLDDQDRSVRLFADMEGQQRWAEHHRNIIRRFGRFPHRNAILGRESTPEELAWLASPEAFNG
jgi:uncharacterized protein (DUF924 family)